MTTPKKLAYVFRILEQNQRTQGNKKKTFRGGLLCKSSICPPAWVKMRRIQNRTTLSLNNFLKLEKVLFGEKKFFFQKNSISGYCRFEIAGFTNKISKFTKKGVFWLHICKTNYSNILKQIFGNFWRHLEISGIWKLGIGKSGNAPKLASLGQFQHIGYFSHSIKVTELGFELRISKF